MEGKRFIRTLKLTNFLSYGPNSPEIELGPLNVVIGPNASGKSNLIEAISLLKAAPVDLTAPVREGGGVSEWLWKGARQQSGAGIDATIFYPEGPVALRHRLQFNEVGQRFELEDEAIESEHPTSYRHPDPMIYYRYQRGHPVVNVRSLVDEESSSDPNRPPIVREGDEKQEWKRYRRDLKRETISPNLSILAQKKDAEIYPELTYLGDQYRQIRIYKEWNFGRNTAPRRPQQVDLPSDFLLEDASNIGLVLNDLLHRGVRPSMMEHLQKFYDDIDDITTKLQGGTVQIFVHEKGLKFAPIPGTRISDGMLRYLCLLAVLLHPEPPSLICIEEPELCLHPDVIPSVGELMVEAAQRTQLIVTTHSDALVSALSDVPEAVVVCDRDVEGTKLQRLDKDKLQSWLKDYSLGEVWRMGELGGNRW